MSERPVDEELTAKEEAICDCGNFDGHPGDCALVAWVATVTSLFRVAWREGQSHCHLDHDDQAAAEAHVARLVVNPKVPIAFWYEVPLIEPTDYTPPAPTAPLPVLSRLLGRRPNEGAA